MIDDTERQNEASTPKRPVINALPSPSLRPRPVTSSPAHDSATTISTFMTAVVHSKQNSDLVYDAALVFWRIVTNIFFREIRPRGAFNIPREGPVIFVAAPHNNQVCKHL